MTILDVAMKQAEIKRAAFKVDKLKEIIERLQSEQDWMVEDDGSIKEYYLEEFTAINELKEVLCNMACKL